MCIFDYVLNPCVLLGNKYFFIFIVIVIVIEINHEANPHVMWDVIKTAVRGESIKYGTKKKKSIETEMRNLENKITDLESHLSGSNDTQIWDDINQTKETLNDLIKKRTQGAIVRSRIQWYEEGERNSRYFFNLEKRNSNLKSINRLELENNTITEDPTLILQEMKHFYESLYKGNDVQNPEVYLSNLKTAKISEENYNKINENITESELLKIIKSLQNNKTPGEDGLPAEFYKFFWQDIKTPLLSSFIYSSEKGFLSITQKRGILCLIPKKSDPLKLKNWRPISLLNQDYKIMAKLIAERIKICLHNLIDADQSGFLKGRYIGQNITTVFDIMHFAESENIPAILVSVDFEKAFDKLDWSFVHKSLENYNFPPFIRQWVKILYTDIVSCVTNNGWHSNYFRLSRGVRQGRPLSPYLFILCAEFLATDIRQNNKIQGIKIGSKNFKIRQYADDTQIFSHFTEESVKEIIKTFSSFSSVSGLEINYNKTEVMRIGLYNYDTTGLEMDIGTNQDTGDHTDPRHNQDCWNKH